MNDLLDSMINAKALHIIQSYRGLLFNSIELNMDNLEVSEKPAGYELTDDDGNYFLLLLNHMDCQKEDDDYVFKDDILETRLIIEG